MGTPDTGPLWDRDPGDGPCGDQLPENTAGRGREAAPGRPRLRLVRRVWRPGPVGPPEVDPGLPGMPWPERCAEAIRYAALRAEHWLSSQGVLREWLRLTLWAGIALLAAALLVVPPATLILEGVASWAGLIEATMSSINATVMGLPPIVIATGSVLLAARLLNRRWHTRRGQRRSRDQDDPYG
jgi:hypothetical protein